MSYEWLTEAELSPEVARIISPSTILLCQIRGPAREVHYNPSVGINIILKELADTLYPDTSLTVNSIPKTFTWSNRIYSWKPGSFKDSSC
jgi:hypothetical protein